MIQILWLWNRFRFSYIFKILSLCVCLENVLSFVYLSGLSGRLDAAHRWTKLYCRFSTDAPFHLVLGSQYHIFGKDRKIYFILYVSNHAEFADWYVEFYLLFCDLLCILTTKYFKARQYRLEDTYMGFNSFAFQTKGWIHFLHTLL